jgi:hypothetical protein
MQLNEACGGHNRQCACACRRLESEVKPMLSGIMLRRHQQWLETDGNLHPEHVNWSGDGHKVCLRVAIGATGDIKRRNDVLAIEIRHFCCFEELIFNAGPQLAK